MKFLIDNAISPKVSEILCANGFDCVHVRDLGIGNAADVVIFERAARDGRTLISSDTDFGTLLATRQAVVPSVVLLRKVANHRPFVQAAILLANLAIIEDSLERGCVAVMSDSRIRIRKLPIVDM